MKEKENIKEIKDPKIISEEKAKAHFKKVCVHGVPADYYCKGCKKVISIPEDAVVKE